MDGRQQRAEVSSSSSKLFVYTTVDARDEFEEKYERANQNLLQLTAGLSDKDLHDLLSGLVCKDKQHEEISLGLVYQILTDTAQAAKAYRDLTLLTRDGLVFVTNNMSILIAERYQKLTEIARRQTLWILRELVKNQVLNVDIILWNTLRQASGGDVSPRNLMLVEGLLDIMIENRAWLEKHSFLVGTVVYTYVRLIEDHHGMMLSALRNKEVKFIISLIRDRFVDVIPLGRDFVRLLQNVARIPEFDQLWRDILLNPKSLLATFTGVWQLLQIRTSRRFLQCRLTPEVERKMHFFTSSVKFGSHKRYQDWFQDKYFATPESHSLRSDLIRFIVNVIHPTNDMLCSDLIPRWAIIGWLLNSCTNTTAAANAKMALFYDWLFFDPVHDNIMNVEPGILVMFHSIRNHPFISSTLLDFLCRTMKNFFPKSEDKIRMGVNNSLRKILEKQVVHNLSPLFESPKLDRELRAMVRDNFREFCSSSDEMNHNTPLDPSQVHQYHIVDNSRLQMHTAQVQPNSPSVHSGPDNSGVSQNATPFIRSDSNETECEAEIKFSDDEETAEPAVKNEETDDDDDLPLSEVRLKEKPVPDKVDLPNAISASFEKFATSKISPALDSFLADLRTCGALDDEQETYVVDIIIDTIKTTLPDNPFPDSKNDEKALATSISYPLFSLFKIMYQYEEKMKKTLQTVLRAVFSKTDSSYGHMLLYFLKVNAKLMARKSTSSGSTVAFKTTVYRMLCDFMEESVEMCLARDLAELESESASMFLWVLPDVFREFKTHMLNNSSVLRVLCGCVDARGLRDLIYSVTQGKLTLFKNEGVLRCVRASLDYETFEQYCLWQLVQAHDVPIQYLQDLLPDLESSSHAEALTYMLLMLKNEKPTAELTRLLLSRETKSRGDQFVTSALRYWCQEYEENLSEIIATLLTSKYPNSSPNKRKRPLKGNSAQNSLPNSEQLLSHLEHFRRSCRHGNGTGTGLYVQDAMQRALQQAFSHSNENTKKQYSDLFALAAEDDTSGVGRRGASGRGRKAPANKKDTNSSISNNKKNNEPINNAYSSDGESSEDDWTKPKTPKRRKKAISESD